MASVNPTIINRSPHPKQVSNLDFSSLQLTRKESRLLEVLISNPGMCLSRGYLLRTVWGYNEGVRTRTVDVHIQRLRKKLGKQGEEHIKTIFRSGYVWYP